MDKLKKYEEAILDILSEYAKIKYANIVAGFLSPDLRAYTKYAIA